MFNHIGDVDDLLKTFKTASTSDGDTNSTNLIGILQKLSTYAESKSTAIEAADLIDSFKALLRRTDLNVKTREQIYRTIAEITKIDGQRQRFTDEAFIESLLKWLTDETKQANGVDLRTQQFGETEFLTAIQLCRALGNICYNNESAREIILKLGGDVTIINLLDVKLDVNDELAVSFAKFRGGLVSNYLLGAEQFAKHAIELNVLVRIERILGDCIGNDDQPTSEEILLNTLQPLSLLTENVSDLNFSPKLNGQLAKLLTLSKDPEVAEICLEMLNYQAENGEYANFQR